MMLPDVLEPGLRVVFCGTAAGAKSAQVGNYYAGPGNQFWATLSQIGLTPHQLQPSEYASLSRYGVGLTDVCKTEAGADRGLGHRGFDVPRLIGLLETHRPRAIAFNGKKAAQVVLGRSVDYGAQAERIADARVYVLPSTSGAARAFWDPRQWQQLATAVS